METSREFYLTETCKIVLGFVTQPAAGVQYGLSWVTSHLGLVFTAPPEALSRQISFGAPLSRASLST